VFGFAPRLQVDAWQHVLPVHDTPPLQTISHDPVPWQRRFPVQDPWPAQPNVQWAPVQVRSALHEFGPMHWMLHEDALHVIVLVHDRVP
jgi:hypothetical protein